MLAIIEVEGSKVDAKVEDELAKLGVKDAASPPAAAAVAVDNDIVEDVADCVGDVEDSFTIGDDPDEDDTSDDNAMVVVTVGVVDDWLVVVVDGVVGGDDGVISACLLFL